MKQKYFYSFLLILVSYFGISQTLDQSNAPVSIGGGSFTVSPTQDIGQSFIAGLTGNLSKIDIRVGNWGSAFVAGDFQLRVIQGNGYGGTVLNSTTFSITTSPIADDYQELSIVLSSPVAVTSGNSYTIDIKGVTGTVSTHGASANYANGGLYFFNGNNAMYNSYDLWFKTFVSTPSPATHLHFDGADDYVDIPKAFTSDFTIEYWMQTTATGLTGGQWFDGSSIVNNEVGGVATDFGTSLLGSKLAFGVGSPDITILSTTDVNDGTWKHIAVTWKQSTGQMQLYINGNLEASTFGSTAARTASDFIKIGTANTFVSFFNGNIDELRIWNKVLWPSDIQSTMNCELQATESGLVAYYKFNQGFENVANASVTTLNDFTGLYNGTLSNFALSGSASNWKAGSTVVTGNTCTVLGSSDFVTENNLKIYPNPSTGIFTIESKEEITVKIYDLVGKVVKAQQMNVGINLVDISNHAAGVYFVKTFGVSGNTTTYKVIKK
ncbi:MAG TPA: LamG-like jellyroll fold domain-containing protein [Flavobacterium sp.]|uniref:LamG-like jellyroll fold domain-containing protein n=1 Tax=Flavobacterium sp. TaxID=239 RepID=UPI002C7D4242|nr:LamG-like jellyroll fold domain-containing protein [Flavobacterium sp.]HSD13027.1 LamG-like jellyroll fold domain-containing protein [Flavobacterium sp.]